MPYAIEEGMCGDWGYYSWEMSKTMDIDEDDVFLILASKSRSPKTPAYEWLQQMGILDSTFSGLCFFGTVRGVSINEAGKQEISLNILFGILPGVVETIELNVFRQLLASIDWENEEETIVDGQEREDLAKLVRDWFLKEKYYLEGSSFTNIINREITDVIEESGLNDLCEQ